MIVTERKKKKSVDPEYVGITQKGEQLRSQGPADGVDGAVAWTVTGVAVTGCRAQAGVAGRQGVHGLRVIFSDGELTWQCHKQILT